MVPAEHFFSSLLEQIHQSRRIRYRSGYSVPVIVTLRSA